MMNLGWAPCSVRVRVRASWDTQQRLTYNPNAPRKPSTSPPIPNNTSSPSYKPSPTLTVTTVAKPSVLDLLKRHKPTQGVTEGFDFDDSYLGYERWLPAPPKVEKPRSVFNAATLAYIGDCIYELYARRHFLFPPLGLEEYNARVMAVVRCEAQDALLQELMNDNFLSIDERNVLRWGKNISSAKTKTKKRAGAAVYNRASSLETLIGYLYLTNINRLEKLMMRLGFSSGSSAQMILKEVICGQSQGETSKETS